MRIPAGAILVETPGFDRTSLRAFAAALRLPENFEVVRDFFGYTQGPPEELSLLRQMRLCRQFGLVMNIIRVGADQMSEADEREIDAAVAFIRSRFEPHDYGVHAVSHYAVRWEEAPGRDVIANVDEARELTREWSVDNDRLDVFVVRRIEGGAAVFSEFKGPKNKDRNAPLTGVVVGLEGSDTTTAFAMAWGVCHYLGAPDSDDPDNLMSPGLINGGSLTAEQMGEVYWHYFIEDPLGYGYLRLSGGA